MHRWIRAALLSTTLLLAAAAGAKSPVAALADKLAKDADHRARVEAAIELGKTYDERALDPLVRALDDSNASVRAAAAAALRTLGDARAVPSLKAHQRDPSAAVRAEVRVALRALDIVDGAKPRLLVKLGSLSNGTRVKSAAVERQVLSESRKKLDELPGVDVLPGDGEGALRRLHDDVPVVMVTTSIQRLAAARDGNSVVYSAKVEYILHSMPDEAIAARVSGSASATATNREAQDQSKSAELRRAVIEAAIRSALRRAPPALNAAARL